MNLRKAGGTATQAALQASSYRGMHTTQRRDSLRDETLAQTSLRAITNKAGRSELLRRILLQAEAGVEIPLLQLGLRVPVRPGVGVGQTEREIDHSFQLDCPVLEAGLAILVRVARTEKLVGDVERRQDGDLQRVARRALLGGEPHLLVHERRKLRHVLSVEGAPNRIALPVDLDVDDAGLLLMIHLVPGGFAPPDPPTPSLAGAPAPRSAPAGRSLSLASDL
jgi:hypothetical protein